jgi:serine/threonine protein kinase
MVAARTLSNVVPLACVPCFSSRTIFSYSNGYNFAMTLQDATRDEADLLKVLRHPYVLQYIEAFREGQFLCIVTELCEGGDLGHFLATLKKSKKYLSEDMVLYVSRDFPSALCAVSVLCGWCVCGKCVYVCGCVWRRGWVVLGTLKMDLIYLLSNVNQYVSLGCPSSNRWHHLRRLCSEGNGLLSWQAR